MSRQVILRAQTFGGADRRRPLLEDAEFSSRGGARKKVRLSEVAGGTAADCVAVCCCCPCGLANLLVLAVYKLPAGLCRKALRRSRNRRMRNKASSAASNVMWSCDADEEEFGIPPLASHVAVLESLSDDKDVIELEKAMWDEFYSAGFWRSPSQRSEITVTAL